MREPTKFAHKRALVRSVAKFHCALKADSSGTPLRVVRMPGKEEGCWMSRRLWEALLCAGRRFLRSGRTRTCETEAEAIPTKSKPELSSFQWRAYGTCSRNYWPTAFAQLPDDAHKPFAKCHLVNEPFLVSPWFSSIPTMKRFLETAGTMETLSKKKRQDCRVILLFDLNGTLVSRAGKKKKTINLRPGLHHLWRLKRHFRLGIFTSAKEHNLIRIRQAVESGISNDLDINGLFDLDLCMCRDHTRPKARARGKHWDTMKPLEPLFSDLSKVILIDDDAYKAAHGEEHNMVIIPSWKEECPKDEVLVHLVNILTEKLAAIEGGDVRGLTPGITAELACRSTPVPRVDEFDAIPSGSRQLVGKIAPHPMVNNGEDLGVHAPSSNPNSAEDQLGEWGGEEGVVERGGAGERNCDEKAGGAEDHSSELEVGGVASNGKRDGSNVVPLPIEFGKLGEEVDNLARSNQNDAEDRSSELEVGGVASNGKQDNSNVMPLPVELGELRKDVNNLPQSNRNVAEDHSLEMEVGDAASNGKQDSSNVMPLPIELGELGEEVDNLARSNQNVTTQLGGEKGCV